MKTRVALFDSQQHMHEPILTLLVEDPTLEVVGVFKDALHCVERCVDGAADIVLLDLDVADLGGGCVTAMLKRELPHLEILIQAEQEDDNRIIEAICAGASGCILRSRLQLRLVEAIHELRSGGAPISTTVARKLLLRIQQLSWHQKNPAEDYLLTPREKEVLHCLVNGLSYKMTAAQLGIGYETVRSHVKKIYEKLAVDSLTGAVAKAIYQRLV